MISIKKIKVGQMQSFFSFFGSIFLIAGSISAANLKIIFIPKPKELKNIKIVDIKKHSNGLNCGTIDCTALQNQNR
jgi:hypothetical protein